MSVPDNIGLEYKIFDDSIEGLRPVIRFVNKLEIQFPAGKDNDDETMAFYLWRGVENELALPGLTEEAYVCAKQEAGVELKTNGSAIVDFTPEGIQRLRNTLGLDNKQESPDLPRF